MGQKFGLGSNGESLPDTLMLCSVSRQVGWRRLFWNVGRGLHWNISFLSSVVSYLNKLVWTFSHGVQRVLRDLRKVKLDSQMFFRLLFLLNNILVSFQSNSHGQWKIVGDHIKLLRGCGHKNFGAIFAFYLCITWRLLTLAVNYSIELSVACQIFLRSVIN